SHLMLNTNLDEKQKNYLQRIDSSAKSLLGIINDILDFSKIEAGKLTIEKVDFDLFKTIDAIMGLLELKIQEKSLELIVSYDKHLQQYFHGDSLRITQILTNLLSNSVKFTDEGEIGLYIAKVSQSRIRFEVRDTGIGLSKEQQSKLFESFSQADGSTTRKYGGTGLGLTISKQLTELMNGEVWIESEYAKGSSFFCEIELEEQNSKSDYLTFDDKKVLIVDDNPKWLQILKSMLESFKVESDLLSSSSEVLEKIVNAKESYDIILIDWQMPQLDGIETAKKIESYLRESNLNQIPIVMMVSSYYQEAITQSASSVGVEYFLQKPINPSTLNGLLGTIFLGKGVVEETQESQESRLAREIMSLEGSHILLVDDNETNQEIIFGLLEESGIIIDSACNGKEVVEKYRANPKKYELILMDIQMPIMDGYEATSIIRQVDKDIPIVALTANAMKEDIQKSQKVGMQEHLNKPIDVKKLYEVLLKYLTQKCEITTLSTTKSNKAYIPNLKHIDTTKGLDYLLGNQKLYLKLLINFEKDHRGFNVESLDEDTFERKIHTLKGLSANIGASTLHQITLKLEKKKERATLNAFSQELQKIVDELSRKLPQYTSKEDVTLKESISDEDKTELFEELKVALDLMELQSCHAVIEKIDKYALGDQDRDLFNGVKELVENYELDEAFELVESR
ncbi:MAG: response regulator, partial [Campylobacterota bacterium]|nr:response regulator [Campylobacterota bacterium]